MRSIRFTTAGLALAIAGFVLAAQQASAQENQLEQSADAALKALYAKSPTAEKLGQTAKGVLVFPDVHKLGFVVGVQGGEGVLFRDGEPAGYYSTSAGSVGLQAGAQQFAYALFFMTDAAMDHFDKSNKFDVGVGPSIVVVKAGAAKDINTLTAKSDIYAFIYGQKGLMAGVGLQGTKISKLAEPGSGSSAAGASGQSARGAFRPGR